VTRLNENYFCDHLNGKPVIPSPPSQNVTIHNTLNRILTRALKATITLKEAENDVLHMYTQLKKRYRVKSINHWRCDPMVLWEVWILASILSHVHIIITQHALIYSLNYLGKQYFEHQETKASNKLACAIFPEFRCVALSIVYTFHPTTCFSNRCICIYCMVQSNHVHACDVNENCFN